MHAAVRLLRRRIALAGVVAAGALALAACGHGDGKQEKEAGTGSGASAAASRGGSQAPADGAFNDADVTFAQRMIPHHRQAVEMSEPAAERASDTEVKQLAASIVKAQNAEIATMRSWLSSWHKPESPRADQGEQPSVSPEHSRHGMDPGMAGSGSPGMAGMMSDEDMAGLRSARGGAFDKKFTEMMIEHHEGAVEMAEKELKEGRNADAKRLADAIASNQSAEVAKLKQVLGRL
ncbi:DUF305 domain-containing protein [Streptomyces sp. NPDC017056]|uniref:DUF305 domain-containing protein n=1 Tax=Streptomyces sp. NPDC017056 TaxID=3364973 RepID=UPI0037A55278